MIDLLDIEEDLSEEQKSARKTAKDFARKEVLPFAKALWNSGEFRLEWASKMGALGFLGANLKGYNCPGVDSVSYGLIMQELEAVDSGLRSFASVQGALCMWPILHYGNDAQREKYLSEMAAGRIIGCFGLTEPDYGSDPGGMKTTATKVSGGYLLNGAKMWITNATIADVALVWAKHEGVIKGFLVDKGAKGFSSSKIKNKMSLRMSLTGELHFENCFVSDEALLPRAVGLKSALFCLNQARFGIAWGVLGAANTVYDTALGFAKERRIFGKPLAGYQLAQSKLVEMARQISLGQVLMLRLSKKKDRHTLKHCQISLAKMNNCQIALEAARAARDMLGASGISDEYPVMRHLLNLEAVKTYEGTEDIHRLILGKEITGENALF